MPLAAPQAASIHAPSASMVAGLKKTDGMTPTATLPCAAACADSSTTSAMLSAPTCTRKSMATLESFPPPEFIAAVTFSHSSTSALRSSTVSDTLSPVVPATYARDTPVFCR